MDYAAGQRSSDPISMLGATDIPVSMLVAENDAVCNASFAPRIRDELGADEIYLEYMLGWGHEDFVHAGDEDYMRRILSAIETGSFDG